MIPTGESWVTELSDEEHRALVRLDGRRLDGGRVVKPDADEEIEEETG